MLLMDLYSFVERGGFHMPLMRQGQLARAYQPAEQDGRKAARRLGKKTVLAVPTPLVILVAAIVASCSEQSSNSKPTPKDTATADANCLVDAPGSPVGMSKNQLWASYRHYEFCVYDEGVAISYLDMLIKMNDSDAITEKAVLIMRKNKAESVRLLVVASEMGNNRAKSILEQCKNSC